MTTFKTPLHNRQSGFSIVEVMVAAFISLIMLAAVITVFVNTRQSFLFQQGVNALNDNIRFAIQTISHDMRMAGHWAGATAGPKFSDIDNNSDPDNQAAKDQLQNCIGFSPHLAYMINNDLPLYGISVYSSDSLPSSSLAEACLKPSHLQVAENSLAVSGPIETDILTVNYVKPESLSNDDLRTDNDIHGFQVVQRTKIGLTPSIFMNANTVSTYGSDHELENALNLPLISSTYAVSRCDELVPTDPNQPTLTPCGGDRKLLRSSTGHSNSAYYSYDLIATGVEAMSFLMMVDSNRDGDDVRFMNATQLLADTSLGDTPFDAVKAVHITMVVRSERWSALEDTNTYEMPGADYIPSIADDGKYSAYQRRMVTSTVQLRNNK